MDAVLVTCGQGEGPPKGKAPVAKKKGRDDTEPAAEAATEPAAEDSADQAKKPQQQDVQDAEVVQDVAMDVTPERPASTAGTCASRRL
mmetsp:Transcript_55938/g.121695  ORF Transcript_55938/g.121695 Transcript_55938/m.121695 type:complete len:88 (-) Transcript_55938:733-996(-)